MRLFTGIDVNTLNKELLSLQEEFKELINGSFTRENNFHITVEFFGEFNPYKAVKKLENISFEHFAFTTDNLGVFPHVNEPKILWLGLKPENKFIELNSEVRKNLKIHSSKIFHPHITLARIKEVKNKEKFVELLNKERKKYPLVAKTFSLYSSKLTQKGAIHTKLKDYDLR